MPGCGKRGDSRVICYWLAKEDHNYLLTLYVKGLNEDLTSAERALWRRAVEVLDYD